MATINDLPGIACVLPISTRLLIILYSTFSNLVQSLTLAIRLFMDDPGACLIHKEKILLVRDATVSLESLPDMYNAWSSTYRGRLKGECVSVKVWRGEGLSSPSRERTKFLRKLEHELLVWREASMSHPNIAAVHGLIFALGNLPSVVTPYYRNGHINTYISKNPRTELKPLMINVAAGLQYLHQLSPPVSHGDVRGCNILITDDGVPVLSDIGLSQLATPPDWTIPSDDGTRWMAPEVMDPRSAANLNLECPTTPLSDVYSFGMAMLEVYTGNVPFSARRFYGGVVLDVMRGIRPSRPNLESCPNLKDELWHIIQSCWTHDPFQRPSMEIVGSWLRLINHVESAERLALSDSTLKKF